MAAAVLVGRGAMVRVRKGVVREGPEEGRAVGVLVFDVKVDLVVEVIAEGGRVDKAAGPEDLRKIVHRSNYRNWRSVSYLKTRALNRSRVRSS